MATYKLMGEFVTLAEVGERLGLDRSNLHKKIKREKVETLRVPRMTDGGLQYLTAVPKDYADRLTETYRTARSHRPFVER